MRGKLENHGIYELFMTSRGSQILNLNDRNFYAIVKGQKGDMLVGTDADHERDRTVKKGRFYLAYFDNDPEFNDLPHLFLEEGNKFREWILPNDKPTEKDYQKKLVKTGELVSKTKVEEHIKGEGKAGSQKHEGQTQDLRSKNKNELYKMAQKQNIPGRSKMTKEQLVEKLSS